MTVDPMQVGVDEHNQRIAKWPKWFRVCEHMHAAVVDFLATDSSKKLPRQRMVADNVKLWEANAIGSRVGENLHQPVFDFDCEHVYVPSSTEGHGHLIFAKPITWYHYNKIMLAMAAAGLIEDGYYNAMVDRREAWLRTPWTSKHEMASDE